MCEKGIGYAVRVALLGHYCMVVHHDEEGSDGQNCGLGSYLLSAAADMVYPYICRFSTLVIKPLASLVPKDVGLAPPPITSLLAPTPNLDTYLLVDQNRAQF